MEIENNWGINQKIIDTLKPGWIVNVFNKNRDLRRILLSGEMGLATKTKQNGRLKIYWMMNQKVKISVYVKAAFYLKSRLEDFYEYLPLNFSVV